MISFPILLCLLFVGTCYGFTMPQRSCASMRQTSSKQQQRHHYQQLHMLPPELLSNFDHHHHHLLDTVSSILLSDETATTPPVTFSSDVSYSKASYYTILGLYALSFPGLWSTIKRSTKAKVKRKTFVT